MHSDAVERRLGSLQQLAKQGKQVNGLFRLLGSPTVWDWAYEAVAPNKGALTPGVDRTNTLDGYSLARRDGLIKRVRDGSYRVAPTRRQYIPKADGRKRPLGIPTADDKLVQAAVKTVLENIYEPVFAETSHGFRKGRSCHTALENIERTWTGVKWLVEVDISDFFGNIDHDVLLNLLKKRIDDADFLKLVQRMLTAGCMDQGTFIPTFSGTPQGGVISPLLANVVLHELDEFMAGMKGAFDKGERRQPHAEYQRLTIEIRKKRLQINTRQRNGKLDEVPGLLRQIKELEKQRSAYPSQDEMDPGYKRMHYCRYADDFLVGVIGSKADADKVMSDIRSFLADVLKLPVSEAKSGVCKASEGAKFLGYTVRTANSKRLVRRKSAGRTVTTRSPVGRLQLHLPVEKLAKYVETKRLGNYGAVRGDMRPELINSPDADIVVTYNAMLRGLAEYYKLGTQWKTQLNPVAKVWWFSLMKTLSRKHKCSIRATYARMNRKGKVGVELETKKGTRFIEVFKLSQVKSRPEREWGVDCVPNADILAMAGRNTLVDRLKAKACDACGNTGAVEVHHVKRVSDMGDVSFWAKQLAARNRKRVVMCTLCHDAHHGGTLQQRLDSLKAVAGAG